MRLEIIALLGPIAFVYHHFAYPALLRRLARRAKAQRALPAAHATPDELPSVTIIIPAHNEADVIAAKIQNLAEIDYPRDKLTCHLVCDGCTDDTAEIARNVRDRLAGKIRFEIVESASNIGKVAVLNRAIGDSQSDVVALSDASSLVSSHALKAAVAHFDDDRIGVVCPTYQLSQSASEGERSYWRYQVAIKADEAALGAPFGAHGAFYLFRRNLWQPIPADTINDDVILPMRIVAEGYRAVYDTSIVASELEHATSTQDFARRIRIGAGNCQQALRLWRLANPFRPGLAFVFLSGKLLRVLVPFLAIASAIATTALTIMGHAMSALIFATGIILSALAAYAVATSARTQPRSLALLGYLTKGHAASFIGAMRYIGGLDRKPWTRTAKSADHVTASPVEFSYMPRAVVASKRILDVICGLLALFAMLILFVPIALAIKIDSRGPIFYRQLRVGRATPTATYLFNLIKFRTMRTDAEAATGAVWASKNDPRITRVGNFMRKTRLDELPQCINVLKGEMSVIGPRPERPGFFSKLEDAIPFYCERTYGLRPGITGLAQINQAYDQSIEDVRNKVLYDHAYAARLSCWKDWLVTDIGIIFKTVSVMALGKGQ